MDAVIARLVAEERISRSSMLKRSLAAGAGLTILSSSGTAFARSSSPLAKATLRGKGVKFATFVKEAKKEGKINTIALPPDWANYGEIMSTFKEEVRARAYERQPGRIVGAGEPGRAVTEGGLARA
jgi:putative spermidine/putrescine transport system substrate-binding protein